MPWKNLIYWNHSFYIFSGDTGMSIMCETNSEYYSCMWKKNEDIICGVVVGDDHKSCNQAPGLSGTQDGNICTLSFDEGITTENAGSYECAFTKDRNFADGQVEVSVMVQSTLQFEDYFASSLEPIKVSLPFAIN